MTQRLMARCLRELCLRARCLRVRVLLAADPMAVVHTAAILTVQAPMVAPLTAAVPMAA